MVPSLDDIRFLPNAFYSGPATFTFRAWDETSGLASITGADGGTGDVTGFGTAIISSPGSGYSVNDVLTVQGGVFGTATQLVVTSVDTSGAITGIKVLQPGTLYTSQPPMPAPVTGGTGTLAKFTLGVDGGSTAFSAATATATITVNFVNQPPSFTAVNPLVSNENSGLTTTFSSWATYIPGPGNYTAGEAILQYHTLSVGTPSLFTPSGQPTVDSLGNLTYTANPYFSGTSTFTVDVQDAGGTAFGGIDTSGPQTFTLTINFVNQPPTLTASNPPAVNEDSGAKTLPSWASFTPGPGNNVAGEAFKAYHVTGVGNPTLFTAPPALAANGTLTYTLANNHDGISIFTVTAQDQGGTANGGVDTSAPQLFTITVNFVNDQPSFTASNPAAVNEDTGAHTVPGWVSALEASGTLPTDGNETGQTALAYNVSGVTNTALFTVGGQPAVDTTGKLTYTLAPNQNGSTVFTVAVQDSGGTANGGVDTSASQTFTLTVNFVNDQPSFTAADPAAVNEDTGAHTVSGWATNFYASGGTTTDTNELGQTVLAYHTTGVGNTALFTAGGQPAISPAGVLTYTLAPNQSGSSTFTVTVQDSGGTSFGGVDTSVAQTFTLNVNFVNDQPSFTAVNPAAANEDTGAHTVPGWVSAFEPSGTLPTDGNEVGQSALGYTVSGVSNTALFTAGGQPVVSSTGTLTYTLAANQSGLSLFTVTVQDSGGTANGGIDTSASQTFTLTANLVNDQPSFTAVSPATVNEDTGAHTLPGWVSAFEPSGTLPTDGNELSQTVLAYHTTGVGNTALFTAGGQPAISPAGVLTYTLAPNQSGSSTFTVTVQDSGGTSFGGVDTSVAQTFTLNVNFVNDQPSFTAVNPPAANEDTGAHTAPGWVSAFEPSGTLPTDGNEVGQSALAYTVSGVSNTALFTVGGQPVVSSTGTLTYTLAANQSGSSLFTVTVQDSGGTANGGIDTSAAQTFTLTANLVNDQPSFTAVSPATVNEDTGAHTLAGWASAFEPSGTLPTDGNELSQTVLAYHTTGVGNTALFTAGGQPAINSAGTLTYMLAPNQSGSSTFTVTVQDSGGTSFGGVDTSVAQTFTLNVNFVNDQPSFTAVNPAAVNEDTGAHTVPGWVSAFEPSGTLPTDGNEVGQSVLAYTISGVSNTALFTAGGQPVVSTTGTLTYTLAANQSGTSLFTVTVQDSGGTANGGVDTSAAQTFTLTANLVNDQPSFTAVSPATVNEDTGANTIPGWVSAFEPSGTLPTDGNELSQTVLAYHTTGVGNTALFTSGGQPAISPAGVLTYTLAPNQSGSSTFTVTVQDSGGTSFGGVDTSVAQTFTLNVNFVNDQPSFTAVNPAAVNEDTGAHTVPGWVSAFEPSGTLPTDGNELSQSVLAYAVSGVSNTALFTAGGQPVISPAGILTYTLAANQSGSSLFTVTVQDSGGTSFGGVDTSVPQTFTLTANLVNDQPSFTAVSPATVNEDTGAHTVGGWVSAFEPSGTLPTDGNELSQTVLAYHTTGVGNTALFTVGGQPAVNAAGALTYTLAANQSGSSTFTVTVQDSGGTSFGGVDTSVAQTFTLNVNFVNDQPSFTAVSPAAVNEDTGGTHPPRLGERLRAQRHLAHRRQRGRPKRVGLCGQRRQQHGAVHRRRPAGHQPGGDPHLHPGRQPVGIVAVHGDGAGFGRHGQRRHRYFRGPDLYAHCQLGQRPAELHGRQPGRRQRE